MSVLQTMQWGLSSNDLSMLQPSLDALAALMKVWASNPNPAGELISSLPACIHKRQAQLLPTCPLGETKPGQAERIQASFTQLTTLLGLVGQLARH